MTQAEKLEALVRRAIEGGFSFGKQYYGQYIGTAEPAVLLFKVPDDTLRMPWAVPLLADHDFARALFGEEPKRRYDLYEGNGYSADEAGQVDLLNFQYHLQQAVISSDPIDYMYKAVFGE